MKFGFTPTELNFLRMHLVTPLQALGARVFVFGSRARGDHNNFSDLDVIVESELNNTRQAEGVLKTRISLIQEYFDESNFIYKVEILLAQDLASSYRAKVDLEKKEIV